MTTHDDDEISRFFDEGNPNHHDIEDDSVTLHLPVPITKKELRISRRHRNLVHFGIISMIAIVFLIDGAKPADAAFLCLSVVCEILP